MRWTAPPTRRELVITVVALATYIIFYNIEASLRFFGLEKFISQGLTPKLWLTRGGAIIDPDGRKPAPWRDTLEEEIFGEWPWDENEVAGEGDERQQGKGEDRYGAMWSGKTFSAAGQAAMHAAFGSMTVTEYMLPWTPDIPHTKLVQHIPGECNCLSSMRSAHCSLRSGYTILDNVVVMDGILHIVSDDLDSFPSTGSIISASMNPNEAGDEKRLKKWSSEQASSELSGLYIGKYVSRFIKALDSFSFLS
jgi:hypothetical protein